MNILRLSTLSLTLAIAVFTLGLAAAPALADKKNDAGCHTLHDPCGPDPDPDSSGGGKALLFEIDEELEFPICGGAITTTDDSSGQFSVSGNVLWDPNNIHVHFKLQLKDVDPGTYPIFGNNDIACPVGNVIDPVDFPACEGGVCDVGHVSITVKQNRQGRTSGVLQLPGQNCGETTTVWVRVTVDNGMTTKILRSTPVTIVLPPNAVGGKSCF